MQASQVVHRELRKKKKKKQENFKIGPVFKLCIEQIGRSKNCYGSKNVGTFLGLGLWCRCG